MALEKKTVQHFKSLSKPGFHGDGGGLYLAINGNSRLWMFRYKRQGKSHWMSLGAEGDVSLAAARTSASKARNLLRDNIDPLLQKKSDKEAAKKELVKSFETVAVEYIASHKAGWKNAKHAAQWQSTLQAYAYPKFGTTPVNEVAVEDVMACLKPIWHEKTETASRLRGRIENVLDYAKSLKLRAGENPAAWRGHLSHLLPARTKIARVEHHAALPWADMPATMDKLRKSGGTSALCLRFLVLTAARSGEARGARWNEIDMDAKTWTIPGGRMKAKIEHRVPLSDLAMEILDTMKNLKKKPDGLVFPGGREGKPLSDVAVSKALASVVEEVTVHGCRSSFRDWCAESTAYPREVAEAALAHVNRDRVEAAYARTDHFEKRRRVMADWAEFCASPVVKRAGNISSIRASA